jgi:16S rRNA (cytosine967-C5)-methyltransferase
LLKFRQLARQPFKFSWPSSEATPTPTICCAAKLSTRSLAVVDRNLATALVLGVLRWQIRLDHQLQSPFSSIPTPNSMRKFSSLLRMGAFQILHLDRIPARAAIDESVELAKQAGHRFASGMVNAVLRKLAAVHPRYLAYSRGERDGPCPREGHPAWMVERWTSFYGLDAARAICRHGQIQPALTRAARQCAG